MAQMRGMALALAALLLPAAAADGHTEHDRTTRRLAASTPILNGSHPYWIVSTSSSRKPNEGLYLSDDGSCCKSRHCSTSGGCHVRSIPFDRGKHMAFWIWPAPGEHDMFWLGGTSASSRPGHMAYLDWGFYGTTWVWPFHPDRPDSMSEWQFIPTAPSQIDDTEETNGFLLSHYYIVSGPRSRDPNKMLYLADDGLPPTRLPLPFGSIRTPQEDTALTRVFFGAGKVSTQSWARSTQTERDQAAWKLLPVPCGGDPYYPAPWLRWKQAPSGLGQPTGQRGGHRPGPSASAGQSAD